MIRSVMTAVCFVCLSIPVSAGAQSIPYTIDLAQLRPGTTTTISVQPERTLTFRVVNAVPRTRYDAEMLRRVIPLPPIPSLAAAGPERSLAAGERPSEVECGRRLERLKAAVGTLSGVKDEAGVPDAVARASEVRTAAGECSDVLQGAPQTELVQEISKAESLVEETRRALNEPFVLARGEELVVTIRRQNSDRVWTVVYTTGPRGEWRTSYGFNFIVNSISRPGSYYTEQVEGGFAIRKEENRRWMDFVPSIFLTWFPNALAGDDSYLNPTVGLGFDLEAPVVFAGATIVFNQNISLNGGLAAHRQRQLAGRYEPGDIVKENLTTEQLHEEPYRVNPFVSVGIRFGANPFAKTETKKSP